MSSRIARLERSTSESSVLVELNLDGTGQSEIETTVPFYNHMLTALSKHSLIDLTVTVPNERQAKIICRNWKEHSQEIYSYIYQSLTRTGGHPSAAGEGEEAGETELTDPE